MDFRSVVLMYTPSSRLILQIDMVGGDDHKMAGLVTTLQTLCDVHPKAEAKVVPLPFGATVSKKKKAVPALSSLDSVSAEESRSKVLAKSKRSKKNIITDERDESRKPPKKVLLLGFSIQIISVSQRSSISKIDKYVIE